MKQNKVQDVQRRLAEKGLKVSETTIIDAAMDIILCVPDGIDALEEQLGLTKREREYENYLKNKELGRPDNI